MTCYYVDSEVICAYKNKQEDIHMNKDNTYFNAMRDTIEEHRRDSTKPFPYIINPIPCTAFHTFPTDD